MGNADHRKTGSEHKFSAAVARYQGRIFWIQVEKNDVVRIFDRQFYLHKVDGAGHLATIRHHDVNSSKLNRGNRRDYHVGILFPQGFAKERVYRDYTDYHGYDRRKDGRISR